MASAGLLDRTAGFVHALRDAGLPVSVSESLDAWRAFGSVDLLDREQLRAALAATTVKRASDRAAFDIVYDLWFPPTFDASPGHDHRAGELAPDDIRTRVAEFMRTGSEQSMSGLARAAVEVFGQAQAQPGWQSYFSYRVMRELRLDDVMATLLEAMLADQQRGGLAEATLRQTLARRRSTFEDAVAAEVRRRLSRQKGPAAVARAAVRPPVEQIDFLRARNEDMEGLRRVVYPLAHRLATRLASKRRPGRSGRLDFRRTIRSSMATGGVPMDIRLRPRRPHKPELVVLCDVSGSVAAFAQFTVLLTYALHEQFARVRTFAFVDTCDEVTRCFEGVPDLSEALTRMAREAQVVWFDGHSDYGHSFEMFEERYRDALTPGASLLVLGDARNNYRSPGSVTLGRIVGAVRRAYWLNPEPHNTWQTGDSLAHDYAQVIEMVECRNAASLERFIQRLLPV